MKGLSKDVTYAKLLEITEVDHQCQYSHYHQIQHLKLDRIHRVDLRAPYNHHPYKPRNIELKIASHCLYYHC